MKIYISKYNRNIKESSHNDPHVMVHGLRTWPNLTTVRFLLAVDVRVPFIVAIY